MTQRSSVPNLATSAHAGSIRRTCGQIQRGSSPIQVTSVRLGSVTRIPAQLRSGSSPNLAMSRHHRRSVSLLARAALLFLLLLLPTVASAQVGGSGGPPRDVEALLKRMDDLYRSDSSHGELEMQIKTPHWERTLVMELWTEGLANTLVRIKAPAKEKGVSTLKLDRQMWNYLPKVNKVMKIPPSLMMGSWMGSDFTNDDLVKESSYREDYTFHVLEDKDGLLKLELKPRPDRAVVWERIDMILDTTRNIPISYTYFDEENEPVRTMTFEEVKTFGDRAIPSVLRLTPHGKPGNETVIRYRSLDLNAKNDAKLFTLRSLKSGR